MKIGTYWGVHALVSVIPDNQLANLPFLRSLTIDGSILAFSVGLSIFTGIMFGLTPALQSSRLDLNEVLKEGGRKSSVGSGHRLRNALVTSEIALAVVLLIGAGLMMKSLLRLLETDIGFKTQNLLTMTVVAPPGKYADANRQVEFNDQLSKRIQSLPGVVGAGTVNILPLQGGNTTRFHVVGDPVPPPGQEVEANIRSVNESYFQTLGIPIIGGRNFDERDKADAPGVVIIGKSVADRVFAGRDPIGRQLVYGSTQAKPDLIVGVVGDVKITGLDEAIRPVLYYPFKQSSSPFANLIVRTNADPTALTRSVREEIRGLEPDVALFNARTMDDLVSNSPASFMRRFPSLLIGIFAGVALLLASIGIYGVVSYSVSQQTHYIGIRIALGASSHDILKMVLRQGLLLGVVGVGLGVALSFGLMRFLGSLLYEVRANDPLIFAAVAGTLFLVALVACYVPALRATRVDPLVALRSE
jgi:putative ABC transport system permease protein